MASELWLRVLTPALSLTSQVDNGNLLNISESHFSHQKKVSKSGNDNVYLVCVFEDEMRYFM